MINKIQKLLTQFNSNSPQENILINTIIIVKVDVICFAIIINNFS